MPALNSTLGETADILTPQTGTLVPGTGKSVKAGLAGLNQRKFKIGVKKYGLAKKAAVTALKISSRKSKGINAKTY